MNTSRFALAGMFFAASLTACEDAAVVASPGATMTLAVESEAAPYVVILKESFAQPVSGQSDEHTDRVEKELSRRPARAANHGKITSVAARHQVQVTREYVSATVGFAAMLTESQIDELLVDPDVEDVYPDAWLPHAADASLQTVSASSLGQHFIDRAVAFGCRSRRVMPRASCVTT